MNGTLIRTHLNLGLSRGAFNGFAYSQLNNNHKNVKVTDEMSS